MKTAKSGGQSDYRYRPQMLPFQRLIVFPESRRAALPACAHRAAEVECLVLVDIRRSLEVRMPSRPFQNAQLLGAGDQRAQANREHSPDWQASAIQAREDCRADHQPRRHSDQPEQIA